MSLTNILKEFSDPQIPKDLVQQINNFDKVDNIELLEDTPFNKNTAQAYVYLVKNDRSSLFVLRIRKPQDRSYDEFKQFVDHNYDNIVEVYFHKTISSLYEVTIMEYLPDELSKSIETETIDTLFALLHYVENRVLKDMLRNKELSKYIFNKFTNYHNNEEREKDYKDTLIKYYDVDNDARHLMDDTIDALEQYYDATGRIYFDLHDENIMKSKDGVYKLIDL